MFRFNNVKTTALQLHGFVNFLQEKYARQLVEIERNYPVKWYIEMDNYRFWTPSTTLAFTHLGDQQLTICFLLHNIEKEINSKHIIRDTALLKDVTEYFVEFLFLHELKHMYQFCEGLTLKDYKNHGSYKSNPFEEQANQFALATMKADQPYKYDLLHFILNNGHINQYNETLWQQRRKNSE